MPVYRFIQTYEQIDDIEAESVEAARIMARGFALDPAIACHVAVELVGEVEIEVVR